MKLARTLMSNSAGKQPFHGSMIALDLIGAPFAARTNIGLIDVPIVVGAAYPFYGAGRVVPRSTISGSIRVLRIAGSLSMAAMISSTAVETIRFSG